MKLFCVGGGIKSIGLAEGREHRTMWKRNLLFVGLCATGLLALAGGLSPAYKPIDDNGLSTKQPGDSDFRTAVDGVDRIFQQQWQSKSLKPAARADDLTIARRLSLALAGTIPSLEEIR